MSDTDKHAPQVEPLTKTVAFDFSEFQSVLHRLESHTRELAEYDSTHGRRLYEAVQSLRKHVQTVNQRVLEMRRHVEDDTP